MHQSGAAYARAIYACKSVPAHTHTHTHMLKPPPLPKRRRAGPPLWVPLCIVAAALLLHAYTAFHLLRGGIHDHVAMLHRHRQMCKLAEGDLPRNARQACDDSILDYQRLARYVDSDMRVAYMAVAHSVGAALAWPADALAALLPAAASDDAPRACAARSGTSPDAFFTDLILGNGRFTTYTDYLACVTHGHIHEDQRGTMAVTHAQIAKPLLDANPMYHLRFVPLVLVALALVFVALRMFPAAPAAPAAPPPSPHHFALAPKHQSKETARV